MTKMQTMMMVLAASMFAACTVEDADTEYRVLPVAAQVDDGNEVLVGTYDEATQELTIVPAFVDEMQRQAGDSPVQLLRGEVEAPIAHDVTWDGELVVGDIVRVVPQGEEDIVGARLVVHDEDWVDGLTDAEAATAFPACWDPDSCFDPTACDCLDIGCTEPAL